MTWEERIIENAVDEMGVFSGPEKLRKVLREVVIPQVTKEFAERVRTKVIGTTREHKYSDPKEVYIRQQVRQGQRQALSELLKEKKI